MKRMAQLVHNQILDDSQRSQKHQDKAHTKLKVKNIVRFQELSVAIYSVTKYSFSHQVNAFKFLLG